MNYKAVPRKRRKHPVIDQSSKIFSDAMHNKEFDKASQIAFYCVLKIGGVEGIMNAINDAFNFISRKERRKNES